MTSDADLIRQPFPKRLSLYLAERFPLASHTTLIVFFFASGYLLAEALHAPGTPPALGWRAVGVFASLFLLFFLLRLFDEFKDYDVDVLAHPERIVSRGIVTLGELKVLIALNIATAVAINATLGLPTFLAWLAAFTFAVLMRYEFFVADWLKKDVLVYALTHQVIVPLMCLYMYVASAAPHGVGVSTLLAWHVVAAVGTALGFEIGRKVRAPEEEKDLVDTYSKYFGPGKAAGVVLFLMGLATLGSGMIVQHVTAGRTSGLTAGILHGLLALALLPSILTVAKFTKAMSPKTSKGLQLGVSVTMLADYLIIAAAVVVVHGVRLAF